MRNRCLIPVLAIAAVVVVPGTALAGGDKTSTANSQAGVCLIDNTVEVSCAQSESTTSGQPAEATSEASPLQVLTIMLNEKTCEAVGVPQSGRVTDEQPQSALIGGGAGDPIAVLGSACMASAVQDNNAKSSADTFVLQAGQEGVGSLSVGQSHAENMTENGSAKSKATFTLVEAEGGSMGLTVLECSSDSGVANQGHPNGQPQTEGTLINANGQVIEDPGLCANPVVPLTSAEASHTP